MQHSFVLLSPFFFSSPHPFSSLSVLGVSHDGSWVGAFSTGLSVHCRTCCCTLRVGVPVWVGRNNTKTRANNNVLFVGVVSIRKNGCGMRCICWIKLRVHSTQTCQCAKLVDALVHTPLHPFLPLPSSLLLSSPPFSSRALLSAFSRARSWWHCRMNWPTQPTTLVFGSKQVKRATIVVFSPLSSSLKSLVSLW